MEIVKEEIRRLTPEEIVERVAAGIPVYDVVKSRNIDDLVDLINKILDMGTKSNLQIDFLGGVTYYTDERVFGGFIFTQTIVWKQK